MLDAPRNSQDLGKVLLDIMRSRVLLLDGAGGTYFQSLDLTEDDYRHKDWADKGGGFSRSYQGNHDLLNISRPNLVAQMHRQHLKAGADIIETNTFNSNFISQEEYGLGFLARRLNREAAQIAKQVAQEISSADASRPRFVAGSMGPTNKTSSVSSDVNDPAARSTDYDELYAFYLEAASGLIEGGVDLILIETIFDTLNAKAAAAAALDAASAAGIKVPLILSVTLTDLAGRNLSGQTAEAFLVSMAHFKPLALGINCALGAAELNGFVADLARLSPFPLIAYPNAGLPNELGEYDDTPESFSQGVSQWARDGLVNIVGGCCGTTPEHIRQLADAIKGVPPRKFDDSRDDSVDDSRMGGGLWLSGMDSLLIPDPNSVV